MTEIERRLYGKCRTAFESSCGAEFRLYSDGKFILLQEKLKGILREHGKNLQKEEKS